jgi:hypothetical protein
MIRLVREHAGDYLTEYAANHFRGGLVRLQMSQ